MYYSVWCLCLLIKCLLMVIVGVFVYKRLGCVLKRVLCLWGCYLYCRYMMNVEVGKFKVLGKCFLFILIYTWVGVNYVRVCKIVFCFDSIYFFYFIGI